MQGKGTDQSPRVFKQQTNPGFLLLEQISYEVVPFTRAREVFEESHMYNHPHERKAQWAMLCQSANFFVVLLADHKSILSSKDTTCINIWSRNGMDAMEEEWALLGDLGRFGAWAYQLSEREVPGYTRTAVLASARNPPTTTTSRVRADLDMWVASAHTQYRLEQY